MISGSFFYLQFIFFNHGFVEGIYLIHELIEGLCRLSLVQYSHVGMGSDRLPNIQPLTPKQVP